MPAGTLSTNCKKIWKNKTVTPKKFLPKVEPGNALWVWTTHTREQTLLLMGMLVPGSEVLQENSRANVP